MSAGGGLPGARMATCWPASRGSRWYPSASHQAEVVAAFGQPGAPVLKPSSSSVREVATLAWAATVGATVACGATVGAATGAGASVGAAVGCGATVGATVGCGATVGAAEGAAA